MQFQIQLKLILFAYSGKIFLTAIEAQGMNKLVKLLIFNLNTFSVNKPKNGNHQNLIITYK